MPSVPARVLWFDAPRNAGCGCDVLPPEDVARFLNGSILGYNVLIVFPCRAAREHVAVIRTWLERLDGPALLFLLLPPPLKNLVPLDDPAWRPLLRMGFRDTRNEDGAVTREVDAFFSSPRRVLEFFKGRQPGYAKDLVVTASLAVTRPGLDAESYLPDLPEHWRLEHLAKYHSSHLPEQRPEPERRLRNHRLWERYLDTLAPRPWASINREWLNRYLPLVQFPSDSADAAFIAAGPARRDSRPSTGIAVIPVHKVSYGIEEQQLLVNLARTAFGYLRRACTKIVKSRPTSAEDSHEVHWFKVREIAALCTEDRDRQSQIKRAWDSAEDVIRKRNTRGRKAELFYPKMRRGGASRGQAYEYHPKTIPDFLDRAVNEGTIHRDECDRAKKACREELSKTFRAG